MDRPLDVPRLDLLLQSHDHYGHFDDASIRALALRAPSATWCAPFGVAARLRERGAHTVVERDWFGRAESRFGSAAVSASVTCVPARHFSGRSASDRDATLWCGWILEAAGRRIYFVGDSGHHPDFGEVGRRFGPFDLVLMPVGAYDPRWLMRPVHMNPEEAVAAYSAIVGASIMHQGSSPVMVAMHWGTLVLTDEPVDEPPRRAREAWPARGFPVDDLGVLSPGETNVLLR